MRIPLTVLAGALLFVGFDKVVRIGTKLPELSSPGSGGFGTAGSGGDAGTQAGGASTAGAPDSGAEPDPADVITEPAEAQTDLSTNTSCSDAVNAVPRWSFDTDAQGWDLSEDSAATLEWSGDPGASTPALRVASNTPMDNMLFVYVATPFRDLSDTIVTFDVRLESVGEVDAKLFAQSGDDYAWSDGGVTRITSGAWTCLAIDLEAPVYRSSGFDPTRVRRLGISLAGTDFSVYLDTLSY